ncbi:hypothetical protein FRB90_010620, partial [Tulasnella sp. 427]
MILRGTGSESDLMYRAHHGLAMGNTTAAVGAGGPGAISGGYGYFDAGDFEEYLAAAKQKGKEKEMYAEGEVVVERDPFWKVNEGQMEKNASGSASWSREFRRVAFAHDVQTGNGFGDPRGRQKRSVERQSRSRWEAEHRAGYAETRVEEPQHRVFGHSGVEEEQRHFDADFEEIEEELDDNGGSDAHHHHDALDDDGGADDPHATAHRTVYGTFLRIDIAPVLADDAHQLVFSPNQPSPVPTDEETLPHDDPSPFEPDQQPPSALTLALVRPVVLQPAATPEPRRGWKLTTDVELPAQGSCQRQDHQPRGAPERRFGELERHRRRDQQQQSADDGWWWKWGRVDSVRRAGGRACCVFGEEDEADEF